MEFAERVNEQSAASAEKIENEDIEDNRFQLAIEAWRNLDLTSLIPSLDSTASDLVARQKDDLKLRKNLAQKTREFKKLDNSSKLTQIKSLLKSYQDFIDAHTNYSKEIYAIFFRIYSFLSEAPDPYPLLETLVDSHVTAHVTVPKLTDENDCLQRTVAQLTLQLEEKESRLEHERNLRRSLEESSELKIKEVESSWIAVVSEKQGNWEAKERNLEEKVENQDRLLKEIKASYEVLQRLGKDENKEAASRFLGVSAAELDIVSSELERSNERLAEIEARNEQLRLELAQSMSHAQNSTQAIIVDDDPAFLKLKSENSSLLRNLESSRFEKDMNKRKWEAEISSAKRESFALKKDRDSLRERVQKWADYEDLRRELEILKSIEFATGDDDDLDESSASHEQLQEGSSLNERTESLEKLLSIRNKKLSNEMVVLRVSHENLEGQLKTIQDQLFNRTKELEENSNLVATLENDLLKIQQEAYNTFPSSRSVSGTHNNRYPNSYLAASRRGRSSPTSSIISGFESHYSPQNTAEDLRGGEAVGSNNNILPMVTAQRDRFKKKNSELESTLSKAYQQITSLRNEITALQGDNVKLYEKTRYVSSFDYGRFIKKSPELSSNVNVGLLDGDRDSSRFSQYRDVYESSLSPFAVFRGRESARAFGRMSFPERGFLRITRFMFATRAKRNLFAGYLVALHVMVLVLLYWMGSADVDNHLDRLSFGAVGGGGGDVANENMR